MGFGSVFNEFFVVFLSLKIMDGSNDSNHLMHIKNLEGAHNLAMSKAMLQYPIVKEVKSMKAKKVKPTNMD